MTTQSSPSRPPDSYIDATAEGSQGGVQDKAQQAAGQAQEKAQQAAGQAQARVRDEIDQRSTQLAEQAHQQASDLRSVSGALRDQGQDRPADLADRLAGYAEQAGGYLHDKDADAMLSDAEQFGRQKPAVVAVGALALGFVASRFLKASSTKRYSSRDRYELPAPRAAYSETPPAGEPLLLDPSDPRTTRSGV